MKLKCEPPRLRRTADSAPCDGEAITLRARLFGGMRFADAVGMSTPTSEVHPHPILRLDVVADGSRTSSARVFCAMRHQSVPLEVCTKCIHGLGTRSKQEPVNVVECTAPLGGEAQTPDIMGERTEVGSLLATGVSVVDASSTREDIAWLLGDDRRALPVVDERHALVGAIRDTSWVKCPMSCGVDRLVSTATVVHEAMPVRKALLALAGEHAREATVVTSEGVPLGTFRDVDGLRWIAAHGKLSPVVDDEKMVGESSPTRFRAAVSSSVDEDPP